MTPLGLDEAENNRVIKMNSDKRAVEIGRASKNVHKGLTAALDNAWFDYPILSRTHAKFTASPSQRVRTLSLDVWHMTLKSWDRLPTFKTAAQPTVHT